MASFEIVADSDIPCHLIHTSAVVALDDQFGYLEPHSVGQCKVSGVVFAGYILSLFRRFRAHVPVLLGIHR